MSKSVFSLSDLIFAHIKRKTLMSFQYIEDKNGKYIAEGSLIQLADFLAGSTAKILVQSNINDEDIEDFLDTFKSRVKELYYKYKE